MNTIHDVKMKCGESIDLALHIVPFIHQVSLKRTGVDSKNSVVEYIIVNRMKVMQCKLLSTQDTLSL